jgi:hypothetical protein
MYCDCIYDLGDERRTDGIRYDGDDEFFLDAAHIE